MQLCCCLGYRHGLATNHDASMISSAPVHCDLKSTERAFLILILVLNCAVGVA